MKMWENQVDLVWLQYEGAHGIGEWLTLDPLVFGFRANNSGFHQKVVPDCDGEF